MADSSDGPREDPSLVEQTLDEHRGCMRLLAAVEECLDRKPADSVSWVAELHAALTALSPVMRQHFESEENGPMFRKLPIQKPRLADQLEQLEAEHPAMLEQFDTVLAAVSELDEPEDFELREINARVQLFVARLRRHEAAENELVIQAHWDEIGVGD
jgi:iron-sulfur cluster repair protein YtfE (RIC family)